MGSFEAFAQKYGVSTENQALNGFARVTIGKGKDIWVLTDPINEEVNLPHLDLFPNLNWAKCADGVA